MPTSVPDVLALGRKRQLDSTAWMSGIWQFVKQLAPVLRSWLVTDAAVSQFHLLSVLLRSVSVSFPLLACHLLPDDQP